MTLGGHTLIEARKKSNQPEVEMSFGYQLLAKT